MGYHKVASSAFSEDAESEAYDLYLCIKLLVSTAVHLSSLATIKLQYKLAIKSQRSVNFHLAI
jgi:hypothetical protein